MAEEQRDLISDRASGVLSVGDTQRSALGRKAAFSTLSILVALLIAGQAVTIYYVYQQSGQISKLTKTSQNLQLEALQRKLPANAKPVNNMKMAKANTPLVMHVLHPASFEDLSFKAPASNKTEDIVKHLLLQADPSRKFPELKDNLMDNLKHLKSTMNHMDWKSFESWMDKWLLFQKANNPKAAVSKGQQPRKTIPAEKVQTMCQAEAAFGSDLLGHFRPQCDENGDYLPKQCLFSTGYCWCCYKNGTMIEGTKTREKLDCPPGTAAPSAAAGTPDPEEMIFSGVDMLKLTPSKEG